MMLEKIKQTLAQRTDLAGWTVRHIVTRGAQMYGVLRQTEARRSVDGEIYRVSVLRNTKNAEGSAAVGSGELTLLPGDDIAAGVEKAAMMAGLMANQVHGVAAPASVPDVPILDPDLERNPAGAVGRLLERIQAAAALENGVQLTAAECLCEVETVHLVNSRGIDATQTGSRIDVELTLRSHRGDREAETFTETSRRRLSDIDVESAIAVRARHTVDLLEAGAPPTWTGPVVVRWKGLESIMADTPIAAGVIQTLGSAGMKYAKISPWEIGKSVFRGEVKGDPLTVWANRAAPYGLYANRFDDEGLPAKRLELIHENKLAAFWASQRYAEYLSIAPTGAFGSLEIPPGRRPAAALLAEPHVEVIQFSWFNPEPFTGDFACEIRFGYLVENGQRKPFKGGQLIGNLLDAFANVQWSSETGSFGNYVGPHTARFNELKVAGATS